jgi:hypothetical protein
MADSFPYCKQRPQLLEFAEALNSRPSFFHRDDCGDPAIFGKYGHIFAVPEGFQIILLESVKRWSRLKQTFPKKIIQDGDSEGVLLFDCLPYPEQAKDIRRLLGIPKRKEYSPETLAALRAQMLVARIKMVR